VTAVFGCGGGHLGCESRRLFVSRLKLVGKGHHRTQSFVPSGDALCAFRKLEIVF